MKYTWGVEEYATESEVETAIERSIEDELEERELNVVTGPDGKRYAVCVVIMLVSEAPVS